MSASDQPQPGRSATAQRQETGERGRQAQPAEARAAEDRAAAGRPGTAHGAQPRPAAAARTPAPGPRRVRLTVSRLDPWSVMKLSFLLSVALGIALVVAAGVLWSLLDGMGVYDDVNRLVGEVLADPGFDVHDYIGFSKVLSLVTVIAVVDVVLFTAIATLGAFLYNLASALVGGLHVTLSDD